MTDSRDDGGGGGGGDDDIVDDGDDDPLEGLGQGPWLLFKVPGGFGGPMLKTAPWKRFLNERRPDWAPRPPNPGG